MKRRILLVLIISCFIFSGCRNFDIGDISNVKTNISSLNEHEKRDIEKTFNIIKYEFQTAGFKDCELLTIEYNDQYIDREKELLISNQGFKEAIILTFTFKTGSNPEQIFNANSEYEYTAEFIKDDDGDWKKVNWGQG